MRKSDWIPLHSYNESGCDWILFGRKRSDGMLFFKTKKITPALRLTYIFNGNQVLEIKNEFPKLISWNTTQP